MLRSIQQRDESRSSERIGIVKNSDSSNALSRFSALRKAASMIFLDIDWDSPHEDSTGVKVQRIEPFGRKRETPDTVNLETRLGWTVVPPRDNDYRGILLTAGTFHGESLVIEDFDLGSPHAWKRIF